MPDLMQKTYKGNTYFVTQRCATIFRDVSSDAEVDRTTKYPYMQHHKLDEEDEVWTGEDEDYTRTCTARHKSSESECSQCGDLPVFEDRYERKRSDRSVGSAAERLQKELNRLDMLNSEHFTSSSYVGTLDEIKSTSRQIK